MNPVLLSIRRRSPRPAQRGAAAVEFAMISSVFFMLLFGAIEVGRLMWFWNAAAEATRLGARLAVVCDTTAAANIALRMKASLGLSNTSLVTPTITYAPAGCTSATCETVTVTLGSVAIPTYIPFVNFQPTLPTFKTTLSRESMSSTSNSVCTAP